MNTIILCALCFVLGAWAGVIHLHRLARRERLAERDRKSVV